MPKRLYTCGVDAPIDIGRLQRFVTDFEQQTGMEIYQPGTKTLGKVAIIGAGPAGLQASVTLTNQGYDVTIYEKEAQPGGWLRNGIPQFRLPQSVLDAEIARIEKMGVTIKCNNEIGKTLTLEQLKAENRAVLVTVGLSSGSGYRCLSIATLRLPLTSCNVHDRRKAISAFNKAH